jgi:site-specific DNA-cytosine methylase
VKVLIACEYSGVVRDAFSRLGHDAVSVDLLPTESEGKHIIGDVLDVIKSQHFDLMIAHPPCTDLAVSGAKWFVEKRADGRQHRALEFVRALLNAPIDRIALENPVSIISSAIRKPDQYIQPYEYGHGETKKTGLWLKGLPLLRPTNIVSGRDQRVWRMPPSPDRWKERSRTYQGIASAMAQQWGAEDTVYQPLLIHQYA